MDSVQIRQAAEKLESATTATEQQSTASELYRAERLEQKRRKQFSDQYNSTNAKAPKIPASLACEGREPCKDQNQRPEIITNYANTIVESSQVGQKALGRIRVVEASPERSRVLRRPWTRRAPSLWRLLCL